MKICLMLIAALSFASAMHAQTKEKRWDARLAVGSSTHPFILQNGLHFLNFDIFHPEFVESPYNATVLYKTNNSKIKVGFTMAYTTIKQYYVEIFSFTGSPDPPYVIGKQNIIAIMPDFNYSYLIKKHYQLYSEACLGPAFETHEFYEERTTEHSIHTAFQFTVLGARVGNRFGGFVELGYGYKGIFQAGIFGTF